MPLLVLLAGAVAGDIAVAQVDADVAATPTGNVVRRTVANYNVPDLQMTRDDGDRVSLDQELNDGRAVVLNFIYTSCTTICPLSSQVFSLLQQKLGAEVDSVHLVSISIDPEEDTPSRLRDYARQFHAGKEWNYYTASAETSVHAQVAFGVYRGNKMFHSPVTLVRVNPADHWVRLDGYATANDLYAELHDLNASRDLRANR